MAQQKQQQGKKPSKYYNFGVGWFLEESGLINLIVNWEKNKKANKGQGFKLFLVPVDETGNPSEEGIEIKNFRIKQTDKGQGVPDTAPDYQAYAWE